MNLEANEISLKATEIIKVTNYKTIVTVQKFSVYDWPWVAALLAIQVNGVKLLLYFPVLSTWCVETKRVVISVRRFLLNDQAAPAHRSRNQNYPPFYTGIPCETEKKQPISSNLPYIRKTKFKIVYNHNPYEHLANTISLFYGGGIGKWINLIRVLRSYKGYGRERNNLVWTYLKRQDHEYTIQSTAYSVLNVLNEFPAVKRQPSWAMFPVFVWLFMRTISDVSTLSDVMGSYFSSPDFSNHSDRNTRVMD